ncbi:MAG: aspartate aminotransferase family protein [Luteibaculum sp.]
MKLLDVYGKYDVTPTKAENATVWDKEGQAYLDLYGGHAVISIGHSHPTFVRNIQEQVSQLAFYSNAIQNPLQEELCQAIGAISGLDNYQLFMCNSGAEANENALKIAAVSTGRKKVLAFKNAFHGRTAAAMACTDNDKVQSELSQPIRADFIPMNNIHAVSKALSTEEYAAVIFEPIQGVGGLDMLSKDFLQELEKLCAETGTFLIADEIQSGAGRTGKFFGFQMNEKSRPHVISMAKGIGNGFPVGAVLVRDDINMSKGMLGTTFGGNHLACAAVLSVVEVLQKENLMERVKQLEEEFQRHASELKDVKVKGRGLMLGLEFPFPVAEMRKNLVFKHHIFTGAASNPNVLRILPPLTICKEDLNTFFGAIHTELEEIKTHA